MKVSPQPQKKDTLVMNIREIFGEYSPPDRRLTLKEVETIDHNLSLLRGWSCAANPERHLGLDLFQALIKSQNFLQHGPDFLFEGRHISTFPPLPLMKGNLIVSLEGLPKPELPEWACDKLFLGVRKPYYIDLLNLHINARTH